MPESLYPKRDPIKSGPGCLTIFGVVNFIITFLFALTYLLINLLN
jgi:hypothetical protein